MGGSMAPGASLIGLVEVIKVEVHPALFDGHALHEATGAHGGDHGCRFCITTTAAALCRARATLTSGCAQPGRVRPQNSLTHGLNIGQGFFMPDMHGNV